VRFRLRWIALASAMAVSLPSSESSIASVWSAASCSDDRAQNSLSWSWLWGPALMAIRSPYG
jgi:hypothetical protein